MATMAELHRQSFEARLARIREGGPNTIGEIHVGPREEVRAKDAKKAKSAVQQKARGRNGGSALVTLMVLPIALAIGAVSVFAGRVAAFRLFSAEEGIYSLSLGGMPVELFADLAIAAVLAMILAWTFHLNHGVRRLAVLAGFVAMMTGEIALMQTYPDVFAAFFSETFVAATLANPPATLSL